MKKIEKAPKQTKATDSEGYLPAEEEKRYTIHNPKPPRVIDPKKKQRNIKPRTSAFVISCYYLHKGNRKDKRYIELDDTLKNSLLVINKRVIDKVITQDEGRLQLEDLISKIYEKRKVQSKAIRDSRLSDVNNKAFNEYWAGHYALKVKTKDKASPRHDIKKALSLIEPLSIYTAKKHELEQALIDNAQTARKAARATARLNEMLKWLERKNDNGGRLKLEAPDVPDEDIQYCTKDQLVSILIHVEDPTLKLFARTLFGSGLRLGEALALKPGSLKNGVIDVKHQIDSAGKVDNPKKGSKGQVVVIPEFINDVEKWCAVKDKVKYRYSLYDSLYDAARAAFPDGPELSWVGPHDLRHSHAIHLLENGVPMTQVAQNLRNSLKVCQKYYAGFAHTEGTLELLKKALKSA